MPRLWPALDVCGLDLDRDGVDASEADPSGLLLAIVDPFAPTAAEPRLSCLRIFFDSGAARDAACAVLAAPPGCYDVRAVNVPDEDWARRSQAGLGPITVGRITIVPAPERSRSPLVHRHHSDAELLLVIPPSMGFGTGHHPSTQLCLEALQAVELANSFVLDVGTGSGVLALAAAALGARRAVGIDRDPDAIEAARKNLSLNSAIRGVWFEVADLVSAPLPRANVVVANLTGNLLARGAQMLISARLLEHPHGRLSNSGRQSHETRRRPRPVLRGYRPSGPPHSALILGGILATERDQVLEAFGDLEVFWENQEQEWLGLVLTDRPR